MAKKENSTQDQEQDDIIELTDVVEEQSDDSLLEETIENLGKSEEPGSEPEVSTIPGDEPVDAEETDASLSDEDLDFDALFEELDDENEDFSAGFEAEAVDTTLSPEDEAEVTGGIHTPDSEEDFDALLEDLDKSDDMLSSLYKPESEEEQPSEEETSVSSPQEPVPEEPEEEDIEDIPQMDEAEELEPEEPEAEAKPEMGPQPLEAEGEEESELEPQALFDEEDEETELEPQHLDDQADGEIEPEAPEGGEAIDVRDLANRLERLENAQSAQGISEEQLVSALNELPSDAPFWSRIEERAQSIVESKVREYTQDMENRIAKLQENLDNLASGDLVTRQTLVQEIGEVKEELPSMQDLDEHKQKLRQELQQEMESQIPTAAARVIREEIQNLRSEMEK
ncbi:MAG: hypothetical protein V5B78_07315 [Desulfohalobiaceae bacterium]